MPGVVCQICGYSDLLNIYKPMISEKKINKGDFRNMKLEPAHLEEADAILELYHSVLDTPGCRWSMDYPTMENIKEDIAGDALFCLRENGEIISVISCEYDEVTDAFDCWTEALFPHLEIARLCVHHDYQGRGIAGRMKAYSRLGFTKVGEVQYYGDDYFCFEKEI